MHALKNLANILLETTNEWEEEKYLKRCPSKHKYMGIIIINLKQINLSFF